MSGRLQPVGSSPQDLYFCLLNRGRIVDAFAGCSQGRWKGRLRGASFLRARDGCFAPSASAPHLFLAQVESAYMP